MNISITETNATSLPASSSLTPDNEVFGIASPGVYFGPFNTPERKLAARSSNMLTKPLDSPLRRSPRLSMPRPVGQDLSSLLKMHNVASKEIDSAGVGVSLFAGSATGLDRQSVLNPSNVFSNDGLQSAMQQPPLKPFLAPQHEAPNSHVSTSPEITDRSNACDIPLPQLAFQFHTPPSSDPPSLPRAGMETPHFNIPPQVHLMQRNTTPTIVLPITQSGMPSISTSVAPDLLSSSPSPGLELPHPLQPTQPSINSHQTQVSSNMEGIEEPQSSNRLVGTSPPDSSEQLTPQAPTSTPPRYRRSSSHTPKPGSGQTMCASELTLTPKKGKGKERAISPVHESSLEIDSSHPFAQRIFVTKILDGSRDDVMRDQLIARIREREESKESRRRERSLARIRERVEDGPESHQDAVSTPQKPDATKRLHSLSPNSTSLLSQLFLPTKSPTPQEPVNAGTEGNEPDTSPSQTPAVFPFAFEFKSSISQNLPRSLYPISHSSPVRPTQHNRHLDNPMQTPARRMPIDRAVAEGQLSLQKAAQLRLGPMHTTHTRNGQTLPTSRVPIFSIPSNDSPARRHKSPESGSRRKEVAVPSSPSKPIPPRRVFPPQISGTLSSTPSIPGEQSGSAPALRSSSKVERLPLHLPSSGGTSPLKPVFATQPKVIPAASQQVDDDKLAPASKSLLPVINLKHATSRIPRITSKPRARQVSPFGEKKQDVTDTTDTTVVPPQLNTEHSSACNSAEVAPKIRTVLRSTSNTRSKKELTVQVSSPQNLKRKRTPSPPESLQTMTTEQEVKTEQEQTQNNNGLNIKHAPPETSDIQTNIQDAYNEDGLATNTLLVVNQDLPQPCIPPTVPNELQTNAVPARRTTRARKVLSPPTVHGPQARRKVSKATALTGDMFRGLTAIALKSLTTTNTVKNQGYIAAKLDTEVIRREGPRPDSPTTRVKTNLEKRQAERARQRTERAERRARRSGELIEDSGDDQDDTEPDGSSLTDEDETLVDECLISPPMRRRKGIEDEENCSLSDLERPLKRLKVDNTGQPIPKRSVKWQRSLTRTVYLDDVKPGTRERARRATAPKGCLAEKAKILRLDSWGNLPNSSLPFRDLVPENVVVKRFVYDDDEGAVQIPVKEIPQRMTRSKNKKEKAV